MIRKRSSGLLALMALQASLAQGLGLGDITLHSALDQPLVADIRLRGVGDLGPGQILVNLASRDDFERAGVERTFFLTDMDFAIELTGDGSGTIRVTTERPVKEPYLDFVLELRWPNGRVLREYTVLLDLPTYVAVDQGVARAAVSGAPAGRTATAGEWSGDTYGPVASQETLWSIASRVRPAGVSVQRMMVAIQRANPDAFIRDNINLLKAGAVLKIPALDDLQGLSDTEARAEVSSQNAAWESITPTAAAGAGPAAPGAEAAPADSGAYLRLAGDDAAAGAESAAGGEAPADVQGLRNELSAAQESLSAAERENVELRERVSSLEEQVSNYERLVELKSDEVAAMQESAAEAGEPTSVEPEVPALPEPTESPEAVTPAPEPGWLDRLMQNTTAMVAAVLALLIAMLAFLFKRRQSAESYAPLPESTHAVARRQAAAAAAPAPVAPPPEPARAAPPEPAPPEGPAEPVTGDPISEADIYVAYGRHERAIELLRSAMVNEPDRGDLRLKLMEIYVDQGERDAFLREYDALSAAGDGAALSAARDLLEGDAADWLGESGAEEVAELVKADVEEAAAFEEDLELELEEEAQAAEEGLGELEFGPAEAELVAPEEAPPETVAEPVFDEENEFDILAGTDEVDTKLELARAYVDMGDVEGARDILDEVIKEGQPHQREQANELLARLDND